MGTVKAIVSQGYGVASGQAADSPYSDGTIKLQAPVFKKLGLNIDEYFSGTLNLSIAPLQFKLIKPTVTLENVEWIKDFPAETFSFSRCELLFHDKCYQGLIYYPHPETKIAHFHSASVMEVIAEYIPNIDYGDELSLNYNGQEVVIKA